MGAASGNVQNFGLYENIVVCGGSDGTIQVWDIEEKVLAKTLWQLEGRKIFALKCGPRIVVAWSCTQVCNPWVIPRQNSQSRPRKKNGFC